MSVFKKRVFFFEAAYAPPIFDVFELTGKREKESFNLPEKFLKSF